MAEKKNNNADEPTSMTKSYTVTLTWLGDTDNLEDAKDSTDVGMNDLDLTMDVVLDAHQYMGS